MIKYLKWLFDFRHPRKQFLHIILVTFLVSFSIVRVYSLAVGGSVHIMGYHIHHFYFGMLFLSIGGVLGILSESRKPLQAASALVGVGIGLFADELGLLLNCTTENRTCVYAFPDVIDIVITITLVILLAIILTGVVENITQKRIQQNKK